MCVYIYINIYLYVYIIYIYICVLLSSPRLRLVFISFQLRRLSHHDVGSCASFRQAADNDTGAAAAALFAATLLVTILGLVQLGQVRTSHRTSKMFKDVQRLKAK